MTVCIRALSIYLTWSDPRVFHETLQVEYFLGALVLGAALGCVGPLSITYIYIYQNTKEVERASNKKVVEK